SERRGLSIDEVVREILGAVALPDNTPVHAEDPVR
ncbi:MAG: hypothetical protein JWN96_3009, partial [Mycobacterium sp.]|nr:hypothetical protein [Mycobacterium sp.]